MTPGPVDGAGVGCSVCQDGGTGDVRIGCTAQETRRKVKSLGDQELRHAAGRCWRRRFWPKDIAVLAGNMSEPRGNSWRYLYQRLGEKQFQQFALPLFRQTYGAGVRCFPVGQREGGRDVASQHEDGGPGGTTQIGRMPK
jgi:hypothetical protein